MENLIDFLPEYYHKSELARQIMQAEEMAFIKAQNAIAELYNNSFIVTATDLDSWEKDVGLSPGSDLSIVDRRSRVLSRLMRAGITTVDKIKKIVASYTNGNIEIIENPQDYSFTIKFVSDKGIPARLDDIKVVVEEIKPAHLQVIYDWICNTYADLSKYRYGQLKKFTYYQLRNQKITDEDVAYASVCGNFICGQIKCL